ncbi:uncharacterized protein LOC725379 isoform X3 [Apis mellifera]|uniref:Uncharacterized protein LOC725379 isoform X3 n=1 Tax=Apis mellifera TaxID=7460 RepID=A0A7M7M1C9_APIME|nr:uncharacterized protein LOC725379 isoform X3 [Apis mellifera]|eukprot:XP_016772373.1 uncharacterized protein LOC725379 isoform X3 [Apis mellifera]
MNEMNTSVTSSIISGMLLDNQNYTNTMTNASNEISETYINSTEENGNIQLWNVSKAVTSLPNNTVISFEASSTNIYVSTTTEIFDEFGPPDGIEYIFVPLGVVVFVIILSAVVWVAISLLYLNYNLLLTSICRNKKNKIKNIHQIIILG